MRPGWSRRLCTPMVVLVLLGGCDVPEIGSPWGHAGGQPPEPTFTPGPEKPDPGGRREPGAFTTACPSAPDNPGTSSGGTQLRATTLLFGAVGFNRDIAVSADTLNRLPALLGATQFGDFDTAYREGAFAAGGAYASVSFENSGTTPLSVYDVRPVNIVQECLPLAALILYRNEGGDPNRMTFNLDAASPVARAVDLNGNVGGPYFVEFPAITLVAGAKESLILMFTTAFGAYSFDLLISYEAGGIKHRALLRNESVPFRTATDLCPTPRERPGLSPATVKHLKSLRFQAVRKRESQGVATASPDGYAAECESW